MGKYGTSILLFKRSYTGQYFVELLFEKILMVPNRYQIGILFIKISKNNNNVHILILNDVWGSFNTQTINYTGS